MTALAPAPVEANCIVAVAPATPTAPTASERRASRIVLERYLTPLARFLAQPDLTEIVVNRPGEVFTEGPGGWHRHELHDLSHAHLMHLATAAAGYTRQDIASDHPIVSTTLPGEERCQIVVPPAVPTGTVSLTIRKPSIVTMTLEDFEQRNLFSDIRVTTDDLAEDETELVRLRDAGEWREFLALAVRSRRNIIISGATGSGKTTLSKGLIAQIPANERLITIEDTAELVVPQPNHVRRARRSLSEIRGQKAARGRLTYASRSSRNRGDCHEEHHSGRACSCGRGRPPGGSRRGRYRQGHQDPRRTALRRLDRRLDRHVNTGQPRQLEGDGG